MAFKRTPFNPAGPFLARKNFGLFDIEVKMGRVYGADVFSRLHERRVEQLWGSKHIDMAPADAEALGLDDVGGADPLDRDGNGADGGSLTDAETDALAQIGLDVTAWLELPEPERTNALADALKAAAPPGEQDGGPAPPGGGEGATGAGAAADTAEGENPAAEAKPAEIAAVGALAAYKHSGFGRYFAIDAAGNKIGEQLGKVDATAFAARDGVPLLGMMDALPGA